MTCQGWLPAQPNPLNQVHVQDQGSVSRSHRVLVAAGLCLSWALCHLFLHAAPLCRLGRPLGVVWVPSSCGQCNSMALATRKREQEATLREDWGLPASFHIWLCRQWPALAIGRDWCTQYMLPWGPSFSHSCVAFPGKWRQELKQGTAVKRLILHWSPEEALGTEKLQPGPSEAKADTEG